MKFISWLKIISLVALVGGATMEQVARVRARNEWKAPGRLVDVGGGRRIQIDCRGSGSPTVVLESGLDNFGSLAWSVVQDSIARTTRVCSYSRAGIMWSDRPAGRVDSERIARDLHAALMASGEVAPWLMVGHSIGAAYVTTFTQLYADEVRGLVFVDGSHPDQFVRYREATGKNLQPSATEVRVGDWLSWTGLVRILPDGPAPSTWPATMRPATSAFLPTSLGALAGETEALSATLARAGAWHDFGDRPLIVLTADGPADAKELKMMGLTAEQGERKRAAWQAMHDDQATWSRRGRNELVRGTSHYIQFQRPGAVISAVFEVVGEVRAEGVR